MKSREAGKTKTRKAEQQESIESGTQKKTKPAAKKNTKINNHPNKSWKR
jgi:hypothetical protein